MTEKTQVFADTLLSATLSEGVIRLEFGTFRRNLPRKTGEHGRRNARDATPNHRLLLPLSGFVRAVGVMQEVLKRLEEEKSRRQSDTLELGDSGTIASTCHGRPTVSDESNRIRMKLPAGRVGSKCRT